MKVALVHDYLNEFGGAERVLLALSEIFPKAPIYTSYVNKSSVAFERFKNKNIKTTWIQNIPFVHKLVSPFRFLTPLVWGSLDLSEYDLVISSASWFVTKGFKKTGNTKPIEICYCHTPPRWLYGYDTSVNFKKSRLLQAYYLITAHFMRIYDFNAAQKVDYFIANSEEVKKKDREILQKRFCCCISSC